MTEQNSSEGSARLKVPDSPDSDPSLPTQDYPGASSDGSLEALAESSTQNAKGVETPNSTQQIEAVGTHITYDNQNPVDGKLIFAELGKLRGDSLDDRTNDEVNKRLQSIITTNQINRMVEDTSFSPMFKGGLLVSSFSGDVEQFNRLGVGSAYVGIGMTYGLETALRLLHRFHKYKGQEIFSKLGIFLADEPDAYRESVIERGVVLHAPKVREDSIDAYKGRAKVKGKELAEEIFQRLESEEDSGECSLSLSKRDILRYEDLGTEGGQPSKFTEMVKMIEDAVFGKKNGHLYVATWNLTLNFMKGRPGFNEFLESTENDQLRREWGIQTLMRYPLAESAITIALTSDYNMKVGPINEIPFDALTVMINNEIGKDLPNGYKSKNLRFAYVPQTLGYFRKATGQTQVNDGK